MDGGHGHHGGRIDMARQGDVVLDLPHVVGGDDGDGVLLPVDGALLQRGQHLGPAHRRGGGPGGAEGGDMDLVLHRAQLQPGQVGRLADRTDRVGDVAEPVLGPGQAHDAVRLEAGQQLLSDLTVQDRMRAGVVVEQEREIQRIDLGDEIADGSGRGDRQLDRADLHPLDHVAFAAKGACRAQRDLEGAVRPFRDCLGKGARRVAVMAVGGRGEGQVHHLCLGQRRSRTQQHGQHRRGGHHLGHRRSPPLCW